MMTVLKNGTRVAKLIPYLGSSFDAEVVSTARAIDRQLRADGFDWHDVAARWSARTAPAPRQMPRPTARHSFGDRARYCRDHGINLTDRERAFVLQACRMGFNKTPTPAQDEWLQDIFCRVRSEAA